MRLISRALFLLLLILPASGLLAETVCGRFVVPNQIDLSTSEKRTLCGSSDTPSWQNIPFNQAQFFLRSFLQSRGYHSPTFEELDGKLFVRPGKLTLVTKISTYPERADLDLDKYWFPIGKPLTPQQLNDIEKHVTFKLGRLSYACPTLSTTADMETGEVLVQFEPGQSWAIEQINEEEVPDVEDGMLDRYRAFDMGDPYDPVTLELSGTRLQASGTVINSQYTTECALPRSGTLRQTILPGAPRLVSFGFGFDTENYFIARGSWKNSRYTRSASLLSFQGDFSYREQTLLSTFDYYYLTSPSKNYLKNFIRLERQFEPSYESRSLKLLSAPAWAGDFKNLRVDTYAGPSLQFEATTRGDAPAYTKLLTLDLNVNLQSHMYEFYTADPQEGFQTNFFGSFSNRGAASDVSIAHYRFNFTYLWNVLRYEPSIWVLGFRGHFVTSQPGKGTDATELPPSFKQFLGGSEDMRGFARKELPREGTGTLTKAYIGTELRLNNKLPWNLQPLIFIDAAKIGDNAFDVDPTLFYSPGLGMRWQSPIGTIRFSVAHGYVSGIGSEAYKDKEQVNFYFSLGEQF